MTTAPRPPEPLDDRARALARLQASRAQLREQLLPPAEPPAVAGRRSPSLRALLRRWRIRLSRSPLVDVALAGLQTWWQHHPWRAPGEAVARQLGDTVGPLVRRHPVAAAAVAASLGAALVLGKPWRWPLVAGQIAPLPRRAVRWALHQLANPAVQSVIAAWVLATLGPRTAAAPAGEAEAPDPAAGATGGARPCATAPTADPAAHPTA